MLALIAALLGKKFAPHVVLIAGAALLGYILAVSLQVGALNRTVDGLQTKLAAAESRARTCEDWRTSLAQESDRRKAETAAAIQVAQKAIQAAERRIAAISAPLTSTGACERLLEVDRRITGARR